MKIMQLLIIAAILAGCTSTSKKLTPEELKQRREEARKKV